VHFNKTLLRRTRNWRGQRVTTYHLIIYNIIFINVSHRMCSIIKIMKNKRAKCLTWNWFFNNQVIPRKFLRRKMYWFILFLTRERYVFRDANKGNSSLSKGRISIVFCDSITKLLKYILIRYMFYFTSNNMIYHL